MLIINEKCVVLIYLVLCVIIGNWKQELNINGYCCKTKTIILHDGGIVI